MAPLRDAVPDLLAAHPPREALRARTRLFLDHATAKYGMADALRAIAALMDACVAAGAIRTGIGPAELGADLEGIALTSASPQRRQRAERLLELTLDGLKARP